MAINEYDGNIKLLAENINKVYQSVTCGLATLDRSKLPQPTEHIPCQYIISLDTVEKRLMKVNVYKVVGPDMILTSDKLLNHDTRFKIQEWFYLTNNYCTNIKW